MKTILFINGGKVTGETMSGRFQLRLEWAINYYQTHHNVEDITFFVSGRWDNATENYLKTEAEVAREFILKRVPAAQVIKEEISVELIGNYAFSKPLLISLRPDKVIIITSEFLRNRTDAICQRIFADSIRYKFEYLDDELTGNPLLVDKEANAVKLFEKLFAGLTEGDDQAIREILLYKTPYYFKGLIDDKAYFDEYWAGGYDHFINGITTRNKL